MPSRKEQKVDKKPRRLLLWVAIAGLVFGLIAAGDFDDFLRVARNSLHWHKASGDIVLVKIDDPSIREIGRWPWPRRRHAEMTDALTKAGAKRIFYDIAFFGATNPTDDRIFADALERSKRVYLPIKARSGPALGVQQDALPLPMFARHVHLGVLSAQYNWQNTVWRIPYAVKAGDEVVPHYTALLAGVRGKPDDSYIPDYSLNPQSIPTLTASQVLSGHFDPRAVAGKDVVIGTTTDVAGDQYFLPGTGKTGGVYVHIIGAETLRHGTPVYLGWIPLYLLALLVAAFAERRRKPIQQVAILGGLTVLLAVGPALPETYLVYLDASPGLFVALTFSGALLWRHFRQRGLVNAVTGLPNLNALRTNKVGREQALIVARVLNYAEIVAALPTDSEPQLVDQIITRLSVGSNGRTFYQGDGGIFAWFEESRKPFGHHIDALSALFRNPVRVAGMSLDLSISFGVEIGSGRSPANRIASALVAADEATHDGLKWKCHDPEAFQNASWRLSMLSQLDEAIDKGEVWIAFQPQLDLKSRRIVGAEALARWTHPDKGPIATSEFVVAAEQHDRIGKLTDFVLEQAVAAAASINKHGDQFKMAVNLSARLLLDKHLVLRVSAMLARHKLDPRNLTLELTETSELVDSADSLETLARLRDLGIEISIDDYGTGLSTLDYLKKVPANEIKIDQSFVKGLCDNRSDRLMVHSTIGLAHSLGRKVVAEGVEQRDILEALTEMGCDVAQGFIVGRPMSLESLIKRITSDRRRQVA